MRRIILALLSVSAIALIGGWGGGAARAQAWPGERAVVEFAQPMLLGSVILKGKYLLVHDDSGMKDGKPCLYVYAYTGDRPDRLVVSFHCEPVRRDKAEQVTITSLPLFASGMREVQEIQFADSIVGHRVR